MTVKYCALLALLVAAACAPVASSTPEHAERIVSLVPSLTEDLFAIGAGPQVVGVSDATDWPAAARRLPVVASFNAMNDERIVQLHPDIVVGITAQQQAGAALHGAGIRTAWYRDDTYDDIFADLRSLGDVSGRRAQAQRVVADLRRQAARETARVVRRVAKPRVFVVLGVEPIYTVGNRSYIATLLEMAGARNAASDLRDAYAPYSAEALVASQPDALVVDPAARFASVANRPPWNALRAVREGRVFTMPDPDLIERPGPRYVQGLHWLVGRIATVSA